MSYAHNITDLGVLEKMLKVRETSLVNNEATFTALESQFSEWERYGSGSETNLYLVRIAVDHRNSAEMDRKEIIALKNAIAVLRGDDQDEENSNAFVPKHLPKPDFTQGPWDICYYDCGDRDYYDHNGPCPSIQAREELDCAIVHWDGFKQEYWSSANGNQKQIEANARLIAASPDMYNLMTDLLSSDNLTTNQYEEIQKVLEKVLVESRTKW